MKTLTIIALYFTFITLLFAHSTSLLDNFSLLNGTQCCGKSTFYQNTKLIQNSNVLGCPSGSPTVIFVAGANTALSGLNLHLHYLANQCSCLFKHDTYNTNSCCPLCTNNGRPLPKCTLYVALVKVDNVNETLPTLVVPGCTVIPPNMPVVTGSCEILHYKNYMIRDCKATLQQEFKYQLCDDCDNDKLKFPQNGGLVLLQQWQCEMGLVPFQGFSVSGSLDYQYYIYK